MPLYEYQCRQCGERFEALVMGSRQPVCPNCGSKDLEKAFSAPAVRSGRTGGYTVPSGGGCSSGGG